VQDSPSTVDTTKTPRLEPAERPQHARSSLDRLANVLDNERDRWLIWIVVAFATGALIYFSLSSEPDVRVVLALTAAMIIAHLLRPPYTLVVVLTGLTLLTTLGFTAAKLKTEWVRAPVLQTSSRTVKITGFIERIEPRATGGERLTIRPTNIGNMPAEKMPVRIRITSKTKLLNLKTGDPINVKAKLSRPAGPSLPGGYDFARHAWYKRIGAVGWAISKPTRDTTATTAKPWDLTFQSWIGGLRTTIAKRIVFILPGDSGKIATALIAGERGGISKELRDAYRDAGLAHVLSISGLHMAIFGGSVFFVLRFLFALFPAIALTMPVKKWAAVGAAAGALSYLLISGGAFPTVRAFIMISIMFAAIPLDRPAIALRNVAVAALVILVLFPESILSPGFQMSFAAVTALIVGYEAIREHTALGQRTKYGIATGIIWSMGAIILTTIIASFAVAPFAAYHFNNMQHYSILTNLIAIPVFNIVVMPAALAVLIAMAFGLESIPLLFMGYGIDVVTNTAHWVANLPGAVSRPAAMPHAAFAMIVTGGLVLLLIRQKVRLIGLAIIALGIAIIPFRDQPDILIGRDATLVAIKTSNGNLAALVSTRDHNAPNQKSPKTTRKPPYELARWMEALGDPRPPQRALDSKMFRCDQMGCMARVKNYTIAIPRHPAAFRDDCQHAQIIVTAMSRPRHCAKPKAVIHKWAVRDNGTYAIMISKTGDIKIETVAQLRGNRPWAMQPERVKRVKSVSQTARTLNLSHPNP